MKCDTHLYFRLQRIEFQFVNVYGQAFIALIYLHNPPNAQTPMNENNSIIPPSPSLR